MKTILIIDDDAELRMVVTRALRTTQAEVLEAEDAAGGLQMARTHRPDLVLCDLRLGLGSGWEVLSALRADPTTATIPFILITGSDAPTALRQSMNLGADDFLRKPFTAAELLAAVKARLRQQAVTRAETERARQDSEIRFRAMADAALDAMVMMAPDGRISFWNPAAGRIFGHSAAEAIGLNLHDLIVPRQYHAAHDRVFPHFLGTGHGAAIGHTVELTALRKDGTEFPVELSLSAVSLDGQWHSVGFVRDITERKKTEEAMRRSETKFRTLYDSTGDAVMLLDPTGFSDCNQATLAMFGCATREEFCSKHPADLSPAVQPDGTASLTLANQRVATAMEKGSHRFEWMHRRADTGQSFPAEVLLTAMKLDGKPVLQAVVRDITERKRAEDKLRQLSRAVEQSPASIVITDPAGRIEYVNPCFEKVTGYSAAEAIGQNPRILKSGGQSSEFYRGLWNTITSGQEWTGELHNRKKGGEDYWEHTSISPVRDEARRITHFLAVKQDITERKRAEEALRESEHLLRESQAMARLGSYVLDIPGGVWRSSPTLDDIFGIDQRFEHSVAGWAALVAPEDRAAMKDYFTEEVLGKHSRFDKEYRIIRQTDGAERWVHGVGELRFDAQNQPARMVGTIQDITGRKQVERTLHDSQELYSSLVENLPQCVFRKDREGHFLFCNARFGEVVGRSLAEIVGKTDADLFPPELAAAYRQDDLRVMASGQTLEQVEENVGADGRKIFVQVVKTPLRAASGTVIGIQGIFWDITERQQAEAKLAYERNLLQSLMDTSPDYIYFKDLQSRFIKCSNTLAAGFGLGHSSEAVGKSDFDFFTDEHARLAFEDEQEIIRTGRPIIAKVEKEFWKHGRKTKWALTNKVPWRNAAGEIIGTFGISKDITNIKEAEEKLEQMHKQLLETSRQAGMAEVATGVLHNVGNVLNSVNVSATLIGDTLRRSRTANLAKVAALVREHEADLGAFLTGDARGRQIPMYLGQLSEHLAAEQAGLMKEAANLQKNIEHIKDIVAMQQNYAKVSGVTEMVQSNELVEDALRMNASSLVRHDIEVVRQFAEAPPIEVDKHKVLQILVNLIRNAKHACEESVRPDKRITVRVAGGGEGIRISVADNGVGIPPENLDRIFNHGFTTKKDGHGIGLHSGALAAKEMGGALTVHSDGPDRGATFILELPLKPVQQLAA